MGFEEAPFADHADAAAEGGVVKLGGDGIFLLGLFEEAVILGAFADDAFQGVDLAGLFFGDSVDRAPCPITKAGDDLVVV